MRAQTTMVIRKKKRMDDSAIFTAELTKQDGKYDVEDEREGKVRDGLKFLGWEPKWLAMSLQGKRRQLKDYVYRGRGSS